MIIRLEMIRVVISRVTGDTGVRRDNTCSANDGMAGSAANQGDRGDRAGMAGGTGVVVLSIRGIG